jgi:hypothetical protein
LVCGPRASKSAGVYVLRPEDVLELDLDITSVRHVLGLGGAICVSRYPLGA